MIELTTLKPLDEAKVHIKHPIDGTELDITFTVCGMDSKEYRQATRDVMSSKTDTDAESDIEDNALEILVRCTKNFDGIMINGQKLGYSTKNARRVYNEYGWIKDQVSAFIIDKRNFFYQQ